MRSFFCAALLVAPLCSFASIPAAQDTAAPGFALAPAPFPGAPAFGATITLANGDLVIFDGLDAFQYAADGTLLHHLGSLPAFGFPSFVVADSDEDELYVGESSSGAIHRFFTGQHTNPDLVATLPFNYEAALFGSGLFVSAATCGIGCGNEIWRVDLAGGPLRLVARVPGSSGPLAFDGQGNLYYGTSPATFPPPPNASKLYRWTATQLEGAQLLLLAHAQFLGAGFEGAARLAFDRRANALYLVENNFLSGANRIRRVLGSAAVSPVVLEGQTFRSLGNLSLQSGTSAPQLLPYQPAGNAFLTYTTTDFVAAPERFELRARRAHASFEGPGTSGPGPFVLRLVDGPPSGSARLFLCPAGSVRTPERVLPSAGVPLFFGLDPRLGAGSLAGPQSFPLDANGELELGFVNPGGLAGTVAAQLVLYDTDGRVLGSSDVAFL